MCVEWNGEWQKANEDIVAWKIVRKVGNRHQSAYPVTSRYPQERPDEEWADSPFGSIIDYEEGTGMVDSGKFGFYFFRVRSHAASLVDLCNGIHGPYRLLKAVIEQGSEYRLGHDKDYSPTINARTIRVDSIEEVV